MPIKKEKCTDGRCTESHYVCPECGDGHVTPMDNHPQPSPNSVVKYGHEDEERMSWTHVCWDCGWQEEVIVEISRR